MAIYEENGKTSGYCFVCERYHPDPYGENEDGDEDDDIEVPTDYFSSIHEFPIRADNSRSISLASMLHFGVRTELSTKDGKTPVAHFYPYTRGSDDVVAYKKRQLPKDFVAIGDFKTVDLFGQRKAETSGARKLFITEGELDCLSVYQALKQYSAGGQWAHIEPAVVSIANGSSAAVKELNRHLEFLRRFEEIVLVFDQDEPGKKATADVLKLLPEALVCPLSEKDPNAMVMKGQHVPLAKSLLFNSQKHRPSNIVTVTDVMQRALAKPQMGLSWPWPSLTRATYGIHLKKLYGLGSGVGMGKSEWAKEVQAHLLFEHNQKVGIFMLEEDAGLTLKALAGKMNGKFYHKPDEDYDEDELQQTLLKLQEKLLIYDHHGVKDWADVKAAIRYMVVADGIKYIFLDPLTAMVSHLSASEQNDMLNLMMGELTGMVHELDFSVFYFSHLNIPQSGPPHEQGGEALESQMTGSRAMMKYSNYIFMLQGDKSQASEALRNTRTFVARKDRDYGRVIRFPINYNPTTGVFREPLSGGY